MGKHQTPPPPGKISPYGDGILPLANVPVAQETESILARYNVRPRMHAAALAGLDSQSGSLVIREFDKDIRERIARSAAVSDRTLGDLRRKLDAIEIGLLDADLTGAETLAEVSRVLNQHNAPLVATVSIAAAAKRAWNKFRIDRRIERDALHPSPANTLLVLGISAAVETVAGTFIYDGAADSAATAVFYSAGACVVVMTLGLVAGWSLRFAVYPSEGRRSPLSQLLGSTAFTAAVLSVLTVSLTIGHYRDALAAYAANAAVVPKLDPTVLMRPWDWLRLDTLDGMLMSAMTLGLGLIAGIKGWRGFSDPIPGYSKVDRKWREAASDALERQQELRAAFNDVIDKASLEVDQGLARQKLLCGDAETHAREGAATTRQYASTCDRLVDIGNAVLRGAQEAFQEIRPEIPAYFKTSSYGAADVPALEIQPEELMAEAKAKRADFDQNRKIAAVIKRSLVQARARLSAVVEDAIRRATDLNADEAERLARSKLSGGDQ